MREGPTVGPEPIGQVRDELGDKLAEVRLAAAESESPDERGRGAGSPMCPMIILLVNSE